ncbi:SDR family NAD(P)-dependent oxidoreductase [Streptomyces cyaneofuscatus]
MQNTPVALVTGANAGIGRQVAKELSGHGYTVLVGSRDLGRGEAAAAEIDLNNHHGTGTPSSPPTTTRPDTVVVRVGTREQKRTIPHILGWLLGSPPWTGYRWAGERPGRNGRTRPVIVPISWPLPARCWPSPVLIS